MNLIFYIVLFPLLSFFLLFFFQNFFSKKNISMICIFSLIVSFVFYLYVFYNYYKNNVFKVFFISVCNWITLNNYNIKLKFLIDIFSLTMLGILQLISLCVFIFSLWYMKKSQEYKKYFLYMNLFVFFMMIFLLTSNFLSMFFVWELVGLCSYLLIGFYYKKKKNGYAAIKSFLMTRISDLFFLIAIFLIFLKFNTLDFFVLKYYLKEIIFLNNYTNDLFWITFFLTIAVIGKSAQVPLHTWLTGAMVGPTPASALIHAATMVTMGIYLIIRVNFLFFSCIEIMKLFLIIGSITILISSISAIYEKNIKCILAYSTMSQIGYMLLALGTKNIFGAFFHLIIHAFFKSLLFLSAGSIIKYTNNEFNIFKMGCRYQEVPFLYILFLICCFSLMSFPLITSGYYSKKNILFYIYNQKNYLVLFMFFLGVFFTSIYSMRMIFVIFHNINKKKYLYIKKNFFYNFSLFVLFLGCTPLTWYLFYNIFSKYFILSNHICAESLYIEYISFCCSLLGLIYSYFMYYKKDFSSKNNFFKSIFYPIYILINNSWYFDIFYFYIFIQSYCNISQYINNKNFFYIENFFLNKKKFFKKKIFKINIVDIVYHIRWYIFCLFSVLLIIFININYYY
ncbi:NADH-quinone oxidoreductase subunit L [Buchnera aphidicola]|uniref:NADH dehydrogenase I chain L n=1 Tax=Buchnera aphidicola subsp. Cinara cedri (strain Cc) TaxID=372461 RepID=Q057W5_BUCCC|nr:NADH-quinone oxidoreductase subunit L [Buchnera aphidicola]ABJ90584.1 NADH dehydrogenase I chain L [Buchnera aphidicola BCc]